jgi:biotin carboxyl carrier protein
VKEVLAGEGESISKGERVMMMEAMKMDIEIVAPSSGKLSRVFVKAGDTVQEHQPLFSIE